MSHWWAVAKNWEGKSYSGILLFYFIRDLWNASCVTRGQRQKSQAHSSSRTGQSSRFLSTSPGTTHHLSLFRCYWPLLGLHDVGEPAVWSWQHPGGALMVTPPSQSHSPPTDLKDFPAWTLQAWQLLALYVIELFSYNITFIWKCMYYYCEKIK